MGTVGQPLAEIGDRIFPPDLPHEQRVRRDAAGFGATRGRRRRPGRRRRAGPGRSGPPARPPGSVARPWPTPQCAPQPRGWRIGAQRGEGGAVAFDEGRVRGAARQRLQPERAGAGEGVQHPAPATVSRPPQGACSSMSNSACRTRSAVGRVACPAGATSAGRARRRPRSASGPGRLAASGSCSRSTRAGTSSTAPRGSVPSWNGP